VIAAISKLPPETQDDLARFMFALASGASIRTIRDNEPKNNEGQSP
jgi:hypothetical protein